MSERPERPEARVNGLTLAIIAVIVALWIILLVSVVFVPDAMMYPDVK